MSQWPGKLLVESGMEARLCWMHARVISSMAVPQTPGVVQGPNGSFTFYVSDTQPSDPSQAKNWLPAPPNGEQYYLLLRLYGPKQQALDGLYTPPPVMASTAPNTHEAAAVAG